MQEYWEITHARGIATVSVWGLQPAFALANLTLTDHNGRVAGMPGLALARDQAEADLSDKRQALYDAFAIIQNINARVPGIIEGLLTPDDDLHGQLDLIYAEDSSQSQASALRRGRLVAGLWADFDAQRLAATPPQAPLVVDYQKPDSDEPPVAVDAAVFVNMVIDGPSRQKDVADAQRAVNAAKTALRAADKKVDRDNKRWYLAWTKTFAAGTQEGDAARSQIPTEQGTPAPTPLEIATAVQDAGRTVLLTYAGAGGNHATTLELQWKLDGEADFGHSTPVERPQQTSGPFPANVTVTFRTRAANSTAGTVLSAPKAVAIV